ncbi:CLUMA_CG012449, isoform A [Clunio marinus]|uniref:CLUMA_CG012449, isoform A n=1 Tax=Clunio marinus TaxID=568069 RepID=A0A1J1IFP3_9DIPT|nr:CLUMA_CG012449, isoform A [Clunio marinus]
MQCLKFGNYLFRYVDLLKSYLDSERRVNHAAKHVQNLINFVLSFFFGKAIEKRKELENLLGLL